MRFVNADSKLEPIEFLTDVKDWRPTDACGPTAIAAITGVSIEYITHTIMKARGREKPIRGMQMGEVINTLGLLGFRVDTFDHVPRGFKLHTLNKFMRGWGDRHACIVELRSHFVAMDCFGLIDTSTLGQLGGEGHPYLRHRVWGYLEVRKMP